ncbi:MAG: hypothetical protein JJU22_02470 [Gammaproteobacteria bacterium]|nr:hypothetical protein [Gammaproteobacteria bacterium]
MRLGSLLLAALMAFLVSAFTPLSRAPAVVLIWAAGVLAFAQVDAATRRLTLILMMAGLAATAGSLLLGAGFDALAMGGVNLPIIALFLGVAFLSLVGPAVPVVESPPPRRGGLWRTMAAIHLIGAVINMSMVAIAGDRLARDGTLARREAILLARSYCAAAFWSPFFVAAAVAHTYAPDARASFYLPLGIIGALCAFALTAREVVRLDPEAPLPEFRPDRSAWQLTLALLGTALLLKALLPALPMVIIVAAVTPPLALLLMPWGNPAAAARQLLATTLPATASQVVLFLAAGVFAYGASSLIPPALAALDLLPDSVPLLVYPLATAAIILAAYAGLHPLISIAALSSALLPAGAQHSLLAFCFLSGWAIGTAVAPLSGMNLFLIGRYRLRAREIARWGPGYALAMLGVVTVLTVVGHGLLESGLLLNELTND